VADNSDQAIKWLRHSSPYINAHRGKTFVIMLPGDCIDTPNFTNIISDLALLEGLGVKLIIVHGARKQIEQELKSSDTKSEFHRGLRITTQSDIPSVLKAVGATRFILESSFSAGLPDSPMYGAKVKIRGGNFITAMPQGIINGIDFQHTGKVRNVDIDAVADLLEEQSIVLISPLGYSLTGEIFNLSFADVAVKVAIDIQADKLIAYNDDGSIQTEDQKAFRELTLLRCEKFLVAQQNNQSNTYFSLRACYNACDGGVPRSHVVSSLEDGALLRELYTRDGSGTMVYRDHYEGIRRARIEDVVGILNLVEPHEEEGVLVKRSRERLETEIPYFTIMEKDSLIIGCAGLYPVGETQSAELACLVIHPDYQQSGRAKKLLTHIEKQASKLKLDALFVLTTQTAHWFIEQGFKSTDIDFLPEQKRSLYNFQRNSKVFIKNI